jgi:hypothetical protein
LVTYGLKAVPFNKLSFSAACWETGLVNRKVAVLAGGILGLLIANRAGDWWALAAPAIARRSLLCVNADQPKQRPGFEGGVDLQYRRHGWRHSNTAKISTDLKVLRAEEV